MILQKLNGSTVQISHVQSNEYGVFAYSIVDKQWIRVKSMDRIYGKS